MKSTRQALGDALLEIKGRDLVVLSADLTDSTKTAGFEKKHPKRFFQCGVAEQNMVGMAVGLALEGKVPFVTTFAAFVPYRTLDHIRVSVCYNNANVKMASTHAGLTVGEDGATHQALEDIAVMRTLPNMTVVVPCDYEEAKKAVKEAYHRLGPVYIRLGRSKIPEITGRKAPFKIGRAEVVRNGADVTIVACGIMVHKALVAADDLLKKHDIHAEVINCHTIKPLDGKTIINSVKRTKRVVVCEEHQIAGGLGGAVAEVLARNHPAPIAQVAVEDTFGESGKADELLEKYGLTVENIVKASLHLLD